MSFESEPGRDGGRPLVGRASEFQPLHCGVRRLHFSARRAAPGTRIVEKLGIQTKDFIGSLLLTLSCPFLPPATCLASPFLSTDVAKRASAAPKACCEEVNLSSNPNFAVEAENWRFSPHVAANLPPFGPEPVLESHMNRLFALILLLRCFDTCWNLILEV